MKGYRTILFGLAVAVVPGALSYLGAVQWQTLGISPGVAAIIGAGIMALRAISDTALGSKN